jgi:hypothetical protein
MPILFLASALVLTAAPLYTQACFRLVFDWEERQIKIDNIAITLGQRLRDLLNELETTNRHLLLTDHSHDAAHACARIPSPLAAKCALVDRGLEKTIRSVSRAAYARAFSKWISALERAQTELATIGNYRFAGDQNVPLREKRCRSCGMNVGWKITKTPDFVLGFLENAEHAIKVRVSLFMPGGPETRWDYLLKAD